MSGPAARGTPSRPSSAALFRLALYYGVAGFGGGYSVLAQLRRELVDVRRWVDAEEFLVLAELSKSLPGTAATSLLALLGRRIGGVRGGVSAAVAFLLPSTILMVACGAGYSHVREARGLSVFFDGMNAAMVGVVAATTLDLGRSALRSRWDVVAALVAATLLASRIVSEPALAAVAAALGAIRGVTRAHTDDSDGSRPSERLHTFAPFFVFLLGAGAASLPALARVFLPIGVLTFGGGLAMIPAIEHTVVSEHHWLDAKAFADAVALGQLTPGPVAICATFIGFRVGGLTGALVATIAMFGPAIALALAAGHSVERFRSSPAVSGALRALAPAVIGMLAAATFSLGRSGIVDGLGVVLAAASFGIVVKTRMSPLWPMLGGGLVQVMAGA